jgi:ribonuclease Z
LALPFEVVFLGTGSPLQNPDRCGAGQILVADGRLVLVDCGWGAARRIRPAGLLPQNVDVLLLTHMHTDHITDIPDFLFQRWTAGSIVPLRVYGPEGTRETIEGFMQALRRDIGFRLAHHGDKLKIEGITVEITELANSPAPQAFLDLDGLRLESFEVDHFPVVPAFGYRASFDGRSVVLSGDTAYCESLELASRGVDMLVTEAMNSGQLEGLAGGLARGGRGRDSGMIQDVLTYHIGTQQIAGLAHRAGVGEVVLTHIIPPIPNDAAQEAAVLAGMGDVYKGPVRVARDMQHISIQKRGS